MKQDFVLNSESGRYTEKSYRRNSAHMLPVTDYLSDLPESGAKTDMVEVLQACSPRTDGREARHPCGAAEFASARPRTAYAAGFLTGTNLLHLDADAERLGIDLNQLSEIDTSVSNIVEDGFASVALVLHVTNLHLELHVLGNLSCPYHRFVLECMCLFSTLEVSLGSETVDDACLEMLD